MAVERRWPNMLLMRTVGDDLPSSVHWVGAGSVLQRLERHEVAEYMPVEDHQHLLQAEVEKREEVEAELERLEAQEQEAANLASQHGDAEAWHNNRGAARAYEKARQLLRDKGTEQGGGDG